jgi:excisionase family DNA binding protein
VNDKTILIDDAARILGVSRRTIYYRIREGRLLTVRTIGGTQRVLVSSVEALLHDIRAREDQRIARLLRGRRRSGSESKPLPL